MNLSLAGTGFFRAGLFPAAGRPASPFSLRFLLRKNPGLN